MAQKKNIRSFRDAWLADFFVHSTPHRKIPAEIHTTLSRKLDIINAATSHRDLRFLRGTDTKSYPGNYRNTPPLE